MKENKRTAECGCEKEKGCDPQETVGAYTGPRIKELLRKYHMTKYRLSQLSGVLPINITRYVSGVRTPSLQTLEKICAGFGITLSEFFEDAPYQADPSLTDDQNSLLEILDGLDESRKKQLLSYGAFLLHEQNEDALDG
ncbi:MAG: helix-turn-helix domain-containing protein [Clostridiales bacterium]|nr:helix-turn-helix domain-containing protein [Clostridiales bacterium]